VCLHAEDLWPLMQVSLEIFFRDDEINFLVRCVPCVFLCADNLRDEVSRQLLPLISDAPFWIVGKPLAGSPAATTPAWVIE